MNLKKGRIDKESVLLAEYMIETECTIRELCSVFSIPVTTVHRRLTENLAEVDIFLWDECQEILKEHREDALIRARRTWSEMRAQK